MRPWSVWRRLLIVLAVTFLLSAWLDCLATMHAARGAKASHNAGGASVLMVFFREHGTKVLSSVLASMAVCAALMVVTERRPRCGGFDSGITSESQEQRKHTRNT